MWARWFTISLFSLLALVITKLAILSLRNTVYDDPRVQALRNEVVQSKNVKRSNYDLPSYHMFIPYDYDDGNLGGGRKKKREGFTISKIID